MCALGGLKLWEGSLDLVKTLNSDIKEDRLLLEGKRVLEVRYFTPKNILSRTVLCFDS
jgi:hypothetical protein